MHLQDSPAVASGSAPPAAGATPAGQARLLASGSLLQQVAQASGLVALLVIVTVLARRLSVAELGAYGLLSSLAGYLLVARNSVANSAVRAMAMASDDTARSESFSTAAAIYAATAAATGLLIAGVGALVAAAALPGELQRQAQLGALALGVVMALAIVATVYLDALRASLLLTRSAALEIAGVALFAAAMLLAVALDASLWMLIGLSGSITLISGTLAAISVRSLGLRFHFRRAAVTRQQARGLLPTAGHLLTIELATLVIYGLDRVILGVSRSASAVGLYEGPIRAHNVFYALNGALGVTALPAAARYAAEPDPRRLRELVLRGSRYTLALVVPLAVTAMALAGPLLETWLGPEFRVGAPALTILVSYWLLYGSLSVTPAFLVGAGRAREAARVIVAVAAANLALSVALTPALGLEGPALGTLIPYVLAFPLLVRLALSTVPVGLGELAREAWLPAYGLGVVLAAVLVGLRLATPLDAGVPVVCVAIAGPLLYWVGFFAVVLDGGERRLVLDVAGGLSGRRSPPSAGADPG